MSEIAGFACGAAPPGNGAYGALTVIRAVIRAIKENPSTL
jgi:hypothetical protein